MGVDLNQGTENVDFHPQEAQIIHVKKFWMKLGSAMSYLVHYLDHGQTGVHVLSLVVEEIKPEIENVFLQMIPV